MISHGIDCDAGRIDQILVFIVSQSSIPDREHSPPHGLPPQCNSLIDTQMAEFIDKVGDVLSVHQIVFVVCSTCYHV